MNKQNYVDIDIIVPCANNSQHTARLRLFNWHDWEIVDSPCQNLLGTAFAKMALCSHYVKARDNELRTTVITQLTKLGAPAVPHLIQALKDTARHVRKAACQALGEIKDPQAVPNLIQALKDTARHVRQAACQALENIKSSHSDLDMTYTINDALAAYYDANLF